MCKSIQKKMTVIVTMLFVTLSLLTIINAASIHANQLHASSELANDNHLDEHTLPRKLLVNYKVEGYEAKGLVSSGESHKEGKEVKMTVHAAKGTRQEWIEGSDRTHEYFTMDYSHVRRRRPIHNKSFPKAVNSSP